ncbi:MAG: hypothetical protein GW903_08875 [Alphaproteobacteria bacterium]|nr:hypothetical protein [Alphaproteobacteria bacterium]NCQ88921.1 hypothetical protein [Alphaproteobacteria bacterium]NCT07824.1 hypothetical protein [Alphaproteobacteria bacterium]
MAKHYPTSVFFSLTGLNRDKPLLDRSGRVRHSVVHTDEETGTMRVLHLDLQKDPKNPQKIRLRGHYLLNSDGNSNQIVEFLNVSFFDHHGAIEIQSVSLLGESLDITDTNVFDSIVRSLNKIYLAISKKHRWVNFLKPFREAGIMPSPIGRLHLPGLYSSGEIKSYTSARTPREEVLGDNSAVKEDGQIASKEPVFPTLFFHAIAGCGPEHYAGESGYTKDFTIQGEDGTLYSLTYHFEEGKSEHHISEKCVLTVMDNQGGFKEYDIYSLKALPVDGSPTQTRIKELKFFHVNSHKGAIEAVNLNDPSAVTNALKAVRMINRTIRNGVDGFEEDYKKGADKRRLLLLSDILSLTGLNKSMLPNPQAKSRGRLVVTPQGGNNTSKVISEYDQHIGANSTLVDVYAPENKNPKNSYVVDLGVLFHDKFDITFSNLGRFFEHKYDKAHHPERVIDAIFITHRHKDHISQLAYLVKAGYKLPAIVMPPLARNQIKREMDELKIDKAVQEEIFDKCIVPDHSFIPNDATRENPHIVNVGRSSFRLSWEILEGERLGQFERYPVIEHEENIIRVGPMPHSDPGYMYEFITPAGGHLFTGDFKLDPTIELYQASYKPWLFKVTAKAGSIDSTGALRGENERTPYEGEIQASIVRLFNEHPDRRMICPIIGSNTARLTTLIAAMGKTGKKYLVADGKAIEDLVRDLNQVHGLKEWAKRVHGVTVIDRKTKEAARIYEEEPDNKYVICPTGTQDEDYSSINRALRDWLPDNRYTLRENDLIVPLQGPIPVGNNVARRNAAKFFAEFCVGADYILPELIEKETDLKLSGSGHASPIDLRELYALTGIKTAYVVHGGPEHLRAAQKIANDNGLKSCAPGLSEGYETLLDGTPRLFRREEAQIVGVRTLLPQKESFWLKRHFLTTVIPVTTYNNSETGIAIQGLERAVAKALGIDSDFMAAEAMSANRLSKSFNRSSPNGYLSRSYPFGVERFRDTNVYRVKSIGGYAAFDTETTGIDTDFDYIDQFSLAMWDFDRKLQFETELRQRVPDFHVKSPEALLVTNTSPYSEGDLPPYAFADRIHKSFATVKQRTKTYYKQHHPDAYAGNPHLKSKTIVIAHNLPFDDRFIRKTMGVNLWDKTRPHASDGMIGIDTRTLARAVYAVYPTKFKVSRKPDSNFLDFTLRSLCENNGIEYDENKAHASALYDSHLAMQLFWKLQEVAPDITEQMIYNSDYGSGELLNDIMGQSTGFDGPHPVFSYMSRRADRPNIQIGSWVGTLSGRYAVVLNLTKDISEVLSLDEEAIHKRLLDRNDDSFELIDLKSNPIILPAGHFYKQNSAQKYPKEMIDRRARTLKEHLNYMSPKNEWTNLSERLNAVWEVNSQSILGKFSDNEPDLTKPITVRLEQGKAFVSQAVSSNLVMAATSIFNPIKQKIGRALKMFRQIAVEYYEGDNPLSKTDRLESLQLALNSALTKKGLSDGQRFLITAIAHDIDPEIVNQEDTRSLGEYEAFHALVTLGRAQEALRQLYKDPERMAYYVGENKEKKKLLAEIEGYVEQKSKDFHPSEAVRDFLHPWRKSSPNHFPNLAA